jgi:biotin transporter BioY
MYVPLPFLISFFIASAVILAIKRESMPRESWNVYAFIMVASGIIGAVIGNIVLWYLSPNVQGFESIIVAGIMLIVVIIITMSSRLITNNEKNNSHQP